MEKLFTPTDFPPVSSIIDRTHPAFTSHIVEYLGEDGTSTNPMLIESFVNFFCHRFDILSPTNFDSLVSSAPEELITGADFFIHQKLISQEFLTHALRFTHNINKIIDWALIISTGKTTKPLTFDDAAYITSIMDTVSIPMYQTFVSLVETLDMEGRIPVERIYSYVALSRMLKVDTVEGTYSDKDIFTLAPLYSVQEVLTFIHAGHSLTDIIAFNQLGLVSAEEVLETGHSIPKAWLEVVKS